MAGCLPTLRSRVRPDAFKCLHREFGSVAANRSNRSNHNNTANGEKRDKLAQRVRHVPCTPLTVPSLTVTGLFLRPAQCKLDTQRRQTIPGPLQAHPRQQARDSTCRPRCNRNKAAMAATEIWRQSGPVVPPYSSRCCHTHLLPVRRA